MIEEERIARLRLIRTSGMGPVLFQQLITAHGNAVSAIESLPHRAARVGNRSFRVCKEQVVKDEWKKLKNIGGDFIFLNTPEYPKQLESIYDRPPVLSILGSNRHLLNKTTIGVVGTRYPSLNALNFTFDVCKEIIKAGYITVSGLARGIDSACHSGSIAENMGATIAVLANGVDVCYPRQNQKLYDQLAAESLLVSELPLGLQPFSSAFPRRNRIISGLSYIVIVVEAGLKSGSLITAKYALEQGREVLSVPSTPMDEKAKGCLYLIKQGASICTGIEDILEAMQHTSIPIEEKALDFKYEERNSNEAETEKFDAKDLTSIHEELTSLLGTTAIEFDALCDYIKKPTGLIRSALMDHEIAGNVLRIQGDRYLIAEKIKN